MTRVSARRPLYARALRLRHIQPSGLWCFLFLEGMIALGVLVALAELASWWAVLVLPAVVAAMVKVNDLVAGAMSSGRRPATPPSSPVRPVAVAASDPGSPAPAPAAAAMAGEARQVSRDLSDTMDPVDSPRQRFRQSARRHYR